MLKYIGKGHIAGVPAKDIADGDILSLKEVFGGASKTTIKKILVSSGLYEEVRAAADKNEDGDVAENED